MTVLRGGLLSAFHLVRGDDEDKVNIEYDRVSQKETNRRTKQTERQTDKGKFDDDDDDETKSRIRLGYNPSVIHLTRGNGFTSPYFNYYNWFCCGYSYLYLLLTILSSTMLLLLSWLLPLPLSIRNLLSETI